MAVFSAREVPERIQWYEGMLLAPQHFQQSSLRGEMLLHYHLGIMSAHHWGTRLLSFDTAMLYSDVLRVSELEMILPDGLVYSYPYQGTPKLELDLKPYREVLKQGTLTVYIVAPALKSGASWAQGDLRRYDSVEGPPVSDDSTGQNEITIPRLTPKVTLMAGEVPPQKYVSMPIARLKFKNDSIVHDDYVPPALIVTPSSEIGGICRTIAVRLREKAMSLADKLRSPSAYSIPNFIDTTRRQVQVLTQALPQFEGLIASGTAHPLHLYLGLCAIAGSVASLGQGLLPPVFIPYNHSDSLSNFIELQEFIFRMIREGILESHQMLHFSYENGSYTIMFRREWMNMPLCIGVRGQVGMSERDIISWVESSVIGSRDKIRSLRERRILGAQRIRVEKDDELVPPFGTVLFALKPDVATVEVDQILEILNTNDRADSPRPSEIVLYIRKKPDEV
ncbi:MAG: type VI secretion system baseplate subunit TssK [Bacteroidetes bacterium]|nr:type VI secretion system baseplate subunit TssK [Bacteroidota bacterium]